MTKRNKDVSFLEYQLKNGGLKTPELIDDDVISFCQHIQSIERPRFVEVKPFNWCRLNCCDLNVEKAIRDNGGKALYGFRIWSVPTMYIEADLHCIWINRKGQLIDITPSEDLEEKVLFLPDSEIKTVRLTFKGDKPRLALRKSLYEVVDYLTARESEIECYYPSDEEMWINSISYQELKDRS